MNKTDLTAAAFPLHADSYQPNFGLTKREYFAIQILQGVLSNGSFDFLEPGQYVSDAVKQADALMEELNKNETPTL